MKLEWESVCGRRYLQVYSRQSTCNLQQCASVNSAVFVSVYKREMRRHGLTRVLGRRAAAAVVVQIAR